jgi:outer membrane protein OmpA-like peptidoglycan-associated protein
MSSSPAARTAEESLAKLKEILLSEDQHRISELKEELERLQTRIEDKELLIETLEPVLADLIEKKIIDSRDEMAEVLSPIMSEAIKNQIEYAKDEVVDALYPVIGKTIRKSIAEAMRHLARNVNEKVQRAVSLRFLLKRIKARAAGVSQEELILKESLPFGIQEVFLIHKETGILLVHASEKSSHSEVDKELISGMLTAIRDFAQTLFTGEEERDLNEIQYEDRQIRLEIGRHAYLAFILSGLSPDDFSDESADLNHEIHKKFLPALREFEGRTDVFQPAHHLLARFIRKYQIEHKPEAVDAAAQKRSRWGFVFILALPLILLLLYIGIFVIPRNISARKISTSLEALKEENAVIRASDVEFDVSGRSVFLSGNVIQEKRRNEIESLIASQPGVKKVINQVKVVPWSTDPEQLLEDVRRSLSESSSDLSQIRFFIEDGKLYMEGITATEEDKSLIRESVLQNTKLPVIIDKIELKADKAVSEIEGSVLYFSTGEFQLDPQGSAVLEALLQKLARISYEQLYIIGHADDIGSPAVNMDLSRRRAEWIKSYLIDKGIQEEKLIVIARGSEQPVILDKTTEGRTLNRRVAFSFYLNE